MTIPENPETPARRCADGHDLRPGTTLCAICDVPMAKAAPSHLGTSTTASTTAQIPLLRPGLELAAASAIPPRLGAATTPMALLRPGLELAAASAIPPRLWAKGPSPSDAAKKKLPWIVGCAAAVFLIAGVVVIVMRSNISSSTAVSQAVSPRSQLPSSQVSTTLPTQASPTPSSAPSATQGDGSPTTAVASPEVSTTTLPLVITVKVTGTGATANSVNVLDGSQESQKNAVALPYIITITDAPSIVAISAMNGSVAANISCEIDVPGQVPVTDHASGPNAVVNCSAGPPY